MDMIAISHEINFAKCDIAIINSSCKANFAMSTEKKTGMQRLCHKELA